MDCFGGWCAAAFDYLCDNIGSANLEHLAGASGSDIEFLSDILNDPVYAELIQVCCLYTVYLLTTPRHHNHLMAHLLGPPR